MAPKKRSFTQWKKFLFVCHAYKSGPLVFIQFSTPKILTYKRVYTVLCVLYITYYKFVVKQAPSALNWPDHVSWDKRLIGSSTHSNTQKQNNVENSLNHLSLNIRKPGIYIYFLKCVARRLICKVRIT